MFKKNKLQTQSKEQEEIKAIRKKYAVPEQTEDKMARLRRLDAAVTKKATTVALVFGIVGALILGTGMSLAMTDIGRSVGLAEGTAMLIGIPVGIVGIVLVCVTYPVYNGILKRERKKIAAEMIRLTDELMQ